MFIARDVFARSGPRCAVVLAAVVIGASGCADEKRGAVLGPESPSAPAKIARATEAAAQDVAGSIARAMQEPAVRAMVRDAMRASKVNEHKLVLQEFVATPPGQQVLAMAASAIGTSESSLRSRIADLPLLDFYMFGKIHRLTWRATPDVVVGAVFDPEIPSLTAYRTDGSTTTLRRSDGVPNAPFLVLHPAEVKSLRNAPQSDTPGDVIQDPADGTLATGFARAGRGLAPSGATPSIGTRASSTATVASMITAVYINHFNIQQGDGWFGDSEMQFVSNAIVPPIYDWVGDYTQFPIFEDACELGTYYQNGVEEDQGYDGLFLISPGVTNIFSLSCNSQSAVYAIRIIEKDGGLTGGDDEFGWRFYASGAYPFGATIGTSQLDVHSYFTNTWDNIRSAYLRIQYN